MYSSSPNSVLRSREYVFRISMASPHELFMLGKNVTFHIWWIFEVMHKSKLVSSFPRLLILWYGILIQIGLKANFWLNGNFLVAKFKYISRVVLCLTFIKCSRLPIHFLFKTCMFYVITMNLSYVQSYSYSCIFCKSIHMEYVPTFHWYPTSLRR